MHPMHRSEADVIDDLAALAAKPGYAHAMAGICYRDNLVSFQGEHKSSDIEHLFDRKRLNRNEITTILGLMSRQPLDLTEVDEATLRSYASRTDELMSELHDAMTGLMIGELMPQAQQGIAISDIWKGAMMKEPIFYGTESAYSFQYRDFFAEKHAQDDDWLVRAMAFSSAQALQVASAMCSLMDVRATKGAQVGGGAKIGELPAASVLALFEFTAQEIAARSGQELAVVEAVFKALTFSGDNGQFNEVGDFNQVAATPLLPTGRDSVLLFSHYAIYEALYESPFFWMHQDKAYRQQASDNRGAFTEQFSQCRLAAVFGKANVHTNVNIYEGKRIVAEADVLVIFGDRVIIVQAKAKKLTLAARKGSDGQIKADFAAAIQKAYDQGAECAAAILSGKCRLENDSGQAVVLPETIKEIYPFCVVSDHYPALAFQVSQYLKYSADEIIRPPFVMDVFLLDVLAEMLDTPLRFISYVRMRLESAQKLMMGHELTALAYHLRCNLFLDEQYNIVMLEDSIAADLDTAMTVRREGLPGQRVPPGILTKMKGTYYERLIEQIERRPHPAVLELGFTLLSMDGDSCITVHRAIDGLTKMGKMDGQRHDFVLGMTEPGTGICFHCNPTPSEAAVRTLELHCAKRKYAQRTANWFGVSVGLQGEIQFGITLDFPWEQSSEMDELTKAMKPSSSLGSAMKMVERALVPKRHGRNDQCPCGSGSKYKRCCL
ncbi:SEC-C domain-containing protein [Pseudomonas sp. MAFF 311096]|uniref:SEC-C domain-containing protein n=1 Tax=Pseudomonas petroselini TaxID=2899822 RepID=A0ABS8R0I9_9PSED|nr:SEC-C metal-binding domain-containing protein [Pseudomonas petroselini]MCD7040954.1 SEC-C domain-containing protein [Pseudomonas petroselini]MCD7044849.1 SEC-C domain-containing protein [Pseudomonas petroselini]MCD7069610.1 SEC-C domain-containing protein [Pseudomonas petroselini]